FAGQQISVSGTQNNNGTYEVDGVSDTTLTLTPAAMLTDETAAGTEITNLHGNLNGIAGVVFINGNGADTLNVDDTGDTTNSAPLFTGSATFNAASHTITRTSGSFLADGFRLGLQILVSGTQSNNGSLTIVSVSATVLTVASSPDLADETADGA